MAYLSLLMLLFVGLGLARERLGRVPTYVLMGLLVVAYVAISYHKPQ
jgi:hypothetical protein